MKTLISILALIFAAGLLQAQTLVLRVRQGEKIADAVEMARHAYVEGGRSAVIEIEPGTYREELTIDVPNLTLRNAAEKPSIAMRNGGVDIDENAVRITWYYGHGYQYGSMGSRFNYGGKRERRWNASVLVTAPGFRAENIIFENSFNMYVCDREVADTLVDINRAEELCGQDLTSYWSEKERPKRIMPYRPKTAGSTEVQSRFYRERASALSFTAEARHCILRKCRVVGRQDSFYGDHGAEIFADSCVLCGAVDYIFGGMTMVAYKCQLVGMCGPEKGDKCYIAASRAASTERIEFQREWVKENPGVSLPELVDEALIDSVPEDEWVRHGLLFEECVVRHATADELVNPGAEPIRLGRPWRWWGETVFECTSVAEGVLSDQCFSLGLTKGHLAPFCENRFNGVRAPETMSEMERIDIDIQPRCSFPEPIKLNGFLQWLGWDEF